MKTIYDEIIENELLFSELATKQFSENDGITRENVKEVLDERGTKIRNIISKTNILIDEHITPYIKEPTTLTKEKAIELQDFATKLSGYKDHIDTGFAYDIRHALCEYAEFVGDEDMYIENLFFKGLTLLYLDSILFREERSQCYERIISYSNRYEEFEQPTRNLIVRAYANYYIAAEKNDLDECFKRYDIADEFWNKTAKKIDPDFPWAAYFRNTAENMCAAVISAFRNSNISEVKKDHIERCYLSALRINEEIAVGINYNHHDYTSAEVRYIYFLHASKYHNNMISAKDLCDFLYGMYKQANSEYTYDNLFKRIHIPALFFYYLDHVKEEDLPKKERDKIRKEVEKDVFNYTMNIPHTISRSHVTALLTNFAVAAHTAFEDFAYLELLLTLTVFRHIPTYAHSVMVGKISFVIVEYLAKYHPEEFIGIPGIKTIEDVEENLGEILLFVWYASLVHDIGKIVYSHVVSFYVRKLNDKEFQMIKQHSSKAEGFIKKSPSFSQDSKVAAVLNSMVNFKFKDNPELFSCFADVAFGHHKSFDGSFGYPFDFDNVDSPVKVIIDVVSIADSIDAATDSVGRSYACEKSLKDMEEDLLSQIETRYSPTVTKLIFENNDLYKQIENIITNERYDVYFSCFEKTDFSSTMLPPNKTLE